MILKRFSPAITLSLILIAASHLQAGASNKNGNPYGNGTFFQTTGTFSGVVRGENLSGTILFSSGVDSSGTNVSTNSSGSSVIVYQGNTYSGNAAGFWNPSSGTIDGQIWGGQKLSGTNSTQIWPEVFNTNSFPVTVLIESNVIGSIQSNTVVDGVTNTVTIPVVTTVTNIVSLMPSGTNSFNDVVYMNGYFSGNTQNQYPNQTFYATGSLTQQQLGVVPTVSGPLVNGSNATLPATEGTVPMPINTQYIAVTVQGMRVSDSYSEFATSTNTVPFSTTYYTVTNTP